MIALYLTIIFPLIGALLMCGIGNRRVISSRCNVLTATASFISSIFVAYHFLQHGAFLVAGGQFYIDSLNVLIILLAAFTTMTTAVFFNAFMWHKKTIKDMRLYNVLYQFFAFMTLLAVSANNIGILWVAVEGATLSAVLLVDLFHTRASIEASWKYFVLGIVGIALALFGTILVCFADAQHNNGMLWSILVSRANGFDPLVIKIAFVFLFVGYGTKIGLVPFHNWLPDSHSQNPVSAILSGLLLNIALYVLIRFKTITNLALGNHLADHLLMTFGLLSFIVAAIMMQRQDNVKRLLGYSSIEHMGLITFTFGLGTSSAAFIGLFYMAMHALAKSAIFMIVGNISRKCCGLIKSQPQLGWSLLIATLVIAGVPPFGIFTSESMIFINCVKQSPLLAVVLVFGFVMVMSGLLRTVHPIVYGEPTPVIEAKVCLWPALLHLVLVLVLGVYIPSVLQQLLHGAARIITG